MKHIPEETKQQAIALRQQGLTYRQISDSLGISEIWCKRNLMFVHKIEKGNWNNLKINIPPKGVNCVYTFFNNTTPLYVGSSTYITQRLYKHKAGSDFFHESSHIQIETYCTYSEMVFNEAQIIAIYNPCYNVRGVSGGISSVEIVATSSIQVPIKLL